MVYFLQVVLLSCFAPPWIAAQVGRRRLGYIRRGQAPHTWTSRFAQRIGFAGYLLLCAGVFIGILIHKIVDLL